MENVYGTLDEALCCVEDDIKSGKIDPLTLSLSDIKAYGVGDEDDE